MPYHSRVPRRNLIPYLLLGALTLLAGLGAGLGAAEAPSVNHPQVIVRCSGSSTYSSCHVLTQLLPKADRPCVDGGTRSPAVYRDGQGNVGVTALRKALRSIVAECRTNPLRFQNP
jgi:hypothetical protein